MTDIDSIKVTPESIERIRKLYGVDLTVAPGRTKVESDRRMVTAREQERIAQDLPAGVSALRTLGSRDRKRPT